MGFNSEFKGLNRERMKEYDSFSTSREKISK
jgi:hypothetical protein